MTDQPTYFGMTILEQAADYRKEYGQYASGYDLVGVMAAEIVRLQSELRKARDAMKYYIQAAADGVPMGEGWKKQHDAETDRLCGGPEKEGAG